MRAAIKGRLLQIAGIETLARIIEFAGHIRSGRCNFFCRAGVILEGVTACSRRGVGSFKPLKLTVSAKRSRHLANVRSQAAVALNAPPIPIGPPISGEIANCEIPKLQERAVISTERQLLTPEVHNSLPRARTCHTDHAIGDVVATAMGIVLGERVEGQCALFIEVRDRKV